MKIFRKEHCPNGRIHIYLCGIKVASYKRCDRQTKIVVNNEVPLKYISADRLHIFLRDKFFEYTGKLPTEKLETLNEKIIWASMFDVTPLKIQCADKYLVRDYVEKTIGKKYLPKLYAVYKNADEFNLDKLPQSFVLSFNAGSGQNLVVYDKSRVKESEIKHLIRKWMLYNHSDFACEMQYYYIKPIIIAREMVDIREDIEYKLYCFNGHVEFIQLVSYIKGHNSVGTCYYDKNWKRLPFFRADANRWVLNEQTRPGHFKEMLEIAEKLSKPFDLVRVDFYETKSGELIFGELTFSPNAGLITFAPDNDTVQKELGKLYKMPPRDENGFAVRK